MKTLLLVALWIVFLGLIVTVVRFFYLLDQQRRMGVPRQERGQRLRDLYKRQSGPRPPT